MPSASRRVAEREHRVGDVVDRHDVDRRVAACGQREVGAARERAQRPVQDVERACPAAVALADDDAGTEDRDRQMAVGARDQALRLELGLLVAVAKALADVELVLAEAAVVFARDEGGGDVGDATQATAGLAALGELEHAPSAVEVDRAGGLQRELERHRRRAVHDLADLPREPIESARHAQTRAT